MRAIILAAGRGSRMKCLTDQRPKCMLTLHGIELINLQISALNTAGIKEIAIVTGYKSHLLSDYGLKEFHNSRWAQTNMASSLESASSWLESSSCIVVYSDIFFSWTAVDLLMADNSPIAITYDINWERLWTQRFGDPLLDAETFRLTAENTLSEIGSNPKSINDIQGQYMGLLRFSPGGWKEFLRVRSLLSLKQKDKIHMTGMLQKIIQENHITIKAIPFSGVWGEVDTINDLRFYEQWYRDYFQKKLIGL